VWALLLGSITAVLQFLLGNHVSPGGFGVSRWLFGFVDIVSLPVLIPLVLCVLLFIFRGLGSEVDFTSFALLWLIPVAALRAIGWGPTNDVILLVAVPLLWTALAVGIPYFITLMAHNSRPFVIIPSILGILALPAVTALVYWAFFSQKTVLGFVLLAVVYVPSVFSLIHSLRHN
jgi:hypothetical protein